MTDAHDDDRWSEDIERDAWRDLLAEAPAPLREELGLSATPVGRGVALRALGIDHLLFNRITGIDAGLSPSELAEAVAGYRAAGIGRYFVHLREGEESAALERWLAEHGHEPFHRRYVKLTAEPPPPRALESPFPIRSAGAAPGAYGAILARGFDAPRAAAHVWASAVGRPGWHTFLAYDGERPIAAAGLFVRGSDAYLSGGSTLPSHRRRGTQAALLHARIERALELGCARVCSETGEAVAGQPNSSFDNMVRLGLEPRFASVNWTPVGTRW